MQLWSHIWDLFASFLALANAALKPWKDEETAFFQLIGVDQKITTYGQLDRFNCQKQTGAAGWNYPIRDLHKLGITSEDTELVLKNDKSEVTACRVSLSDSWNLSCAQCDYNNRKTRTNFRCVFLCKLRVLSLTDRQFSYDLLQIKQ